MTGRRRGLRRGARRARSAVATIVRLFRRTPRPVVERWPGASARRRRRRLSLLALPAGLLVAGALGYLVCGSSAFLATRVSVSGEHRLSAATVRSTAAVPERPLARLNTRAVASRVAALPAVAAVDVRRKWPHTVRISVKEREPLLAVPRGSGYALVDREGVAFATVTAAPRRLPVAALPTVSAADPTTRAVLGVVRALSPDLRAEMLRLEATSASGVTLILRDGRRVVWGADDRTTVKAEILTALLKRHGRVYDVSAPDVVTVAR